MPSVSRARSPFASVDPELLLSIARNEKSAERTFRRLYTKPFVAFVVLTEPKLTRPEALLCFEEILAAVHGGSIRTANALVRFARKSLRTQRSAARSSRRGLRQVKRAARRTPKARALRKPSAKASAKKATRKPTRAIRPAKKAAKRTVRPVPKMAVRKATGRPEPVKRTARKVGKSAIRKAATRRARPAAGSAPRETFTVEFIAHKNLIDGFGGSGIRIRELPTAVENDLEGTAHPSERPLMPRRDEDVLFPVWFGTNRNVISSKHGASFGTEQSSLTRGRADVWIPQSHERGAIKGKWLDKLKHFDLKHGDLQLREVLTLEPDTFYAQVRARIEASRAAGDGAHALVFIHGFNNSFEDAAIRAAQLGCDLEVPGATAFFSWPSMGKTQGYMADEATIEASVPDIVEFLTDFTRRSGADVVHLVAHSMGNRGLLRAMEQIASKADTQGVQFGQIFLAAPDVDRRLFEQLAVHYRSPRSVRTTLYSSRRDLAVHLSKILHKNPRAGYYTPFTIVDGIDTVAVPDFDLDLLGHIYFAQADALLYDMNGLMRHDQPAAKRMRIVTGTDNGKTYFILKR